MNDKFCRCNHYNAYRFKYGITKKTMYENNEYDGRKPVRKF